MQNRSPSRIAWILLLVAIFTLACRLTSPPAPVESTPKVVLQRLSVAFMGQDGHSEVGSGCPGKDGKGSIVDYHLIVSSVNENQSVERILVAGDNSTLTWEWPCKEDWELAANNLGHGNWEIFIAPSLPSKIYTVIFFYDDQTFALGMTSVP
jgi:hypothetical protein